MNEPIEIPITRTQKEMIESALHQCIELNREAQKDAEPGQDLKELKAEAKLMRETLRALKQVK